MSFVPGVAIGLGLYPGDSCHDPQHPWWLPNALHTAYECACMARENRDPEKQCTFSMPGGTDAVYVRPDNVPSLPQIIVETPGYVAKTAGRIVSSTVVGAASGVGQGVVDQFDWKGAAVLAAIGVGAVFLLTTSLGGRR